MKKKATKAGRPRIGQPISITLTDSQRDWIDAQIQGGETRTQVVRRIINEAMTRVEKEFDINGLLWRVTSLEGRFSVWSKTATGWFLEFVNHDSLKSAESAAKKESKLRTF